MIRMRLYLGLAVSVLSILLLFGHIFAFALEKAISGTYGFGGYTYNKIAREDPYAHEDPDGPYIHWPSPNITYRINSSGTTDITGEGEFDAIEAAFDEWEDVSPATINFTRGSNTTHTLNASDGQNVLFWSTSEDLPDLQSSSGITLITYNNTTDEITDVDIVFNDDYTWSLDTFDMDSHILDVQSMATHEIGHLLGIDHTNVETGCPTMLTPADYRAGEFPCKTDVENFGMRSLAQDDKNAINYLYGDTLRVNEVFQSIQSAINFAQAGQTVYVASGTYNEQVTMKAGVDLVGADSSNTIIDVGTGYTAAVYFNGVSDAKLTGFKLRGYAAVDCNNCSPTIEANSIYNSEFGIYAYGSNPKIKDNSIANCTYGIMLYNYSNPCIRSPYGHNTISGSGQGVRCITHSEPKLGTTTYWGNNNITTTGYDIYATSDSPPIYAQNNYWGGGAPDSVYAPNGLV